MLMFHIKRVDRRCANLDLDFFLLAAIENRGIIDMPTNTREAREIQRRANANEAELVRETKTLTRKLKADLKKSKDNKEPAAVASKNSRSKK